MNQIICKYVNATTVLSNTRKFTKSQIASKEFTTDLKFTLDNVAKELNFTHLNDWYKMPVKVSPTFAYMFTD